MTVGPDILDAYLWQERYYDDDLATGNNDGTSEADAWQSITAMIAGATAGQRVNMKKAASPVVLGANAVFPVGSARGTIWFRGYGSVPGDKVKWIGDASTFKFQGAAGPQFFSDLSFDGSGTTFTFDNAYAQQQTAFFDCNFTNDATGTCLQSVSGLVLACVMENTDTYVSGAQAFTGDGVMAGCKLTAPGIVATTSVSDESEHICHFKNVYVSTSSEARDGLQISHTFFEGAYTCILENSVFGAADGFDVLDISSSTESSICMVNNVASGCDQGFVMTEPTAPYMPITKNNAAGANTTADFLWPAGSINWADLRTDISLSGSPYDDTSTLALDNTAGEGAVCRDGVTVGLYTGGSGTDTVASSDDLGGNRHGSDDNVPSPGLVPGGSGASSVLIVNVRKVR